MRKTILLLIPILLFLSLSLATVSGESQNPNQPNPDLQQLVQSVTVPSGFEITLFANNVPNARSLLWTPNGTLFVSTRQAGSVYALRDDNADGVADGVLTIASGLNSPNGIAFKDGSLYVAEISRVLRYDNIEANLSSPPQPVVAISGFPTDAAHGWKFIRFGPDGKLYIPVGAPCNRCQTVDSRYGTIMRMNPDGSEIEVVAQGIRNTVGFDFHPERRELWFTDNGADDLGDDIPADELNRVTELGQHFGFPYCHQGDVPDPDFGGLATCDQFIPPAAKITPHGAALGMRFYTGSQFPDEYVNQIFVAEHGSASRSIPIGYRVMLARLDDAGNVLSYEPFAEGWLSNGQAWGRPVDVEVMPDGSLLVSDDLAGAIYRIRYTLPKPTPLATVSPTP